MKLQRSLLRALPVAALALLSSSCYVITQGTRYLSLQASGRSVQKVLADPSSPEKTKAFLRLVKEVRSYAQKAIGLKDTRSFTSLVTLDRNYVADVVQACAELSFDRYYWNYPVVGKLPYKGFFKREEALAEAARVKARGYDVIVRQVDSFSTLGWMADPLYSFMASYSEADLADLVIHELTHATVFLRGQDDFNEELASFVGDRGSLDWLEERYGKGSPQEESLLASRAASRTYAAFLRETASRLDAVYRSGKEAAEKRAEKASLFASRAAEWKVLAESFPADSPYRKVDMAGINNAWLDLYRLYEGEPELYADDCRLVCGDSLPAFVAHVKALSRDRAAAKDMKAALRREVAKAEPEP